MKNVLKIFTIAILTFNVMPLFADTTNWLSKISSAKNPIEAKQAYLQAVEAITKLKEYNSVSQDVKNKAIEDAKKHAEESADNKNENETPTDSGNNPDSTDTQQQTETPTDTRTDEEKAQALAEKKQAFDDAKATEQSRENRMLTAATTAATGIGGMQLAQGLAEQRADKSAAQDMAAYIATMRCSYANGKSVKAGPDEIELPGGNDANLMKLRNEYFALANDLKERKTALGMKPGIESEEILDKAATGLYDDESVGITSGTYASLYRAQMLGSSTDQEQIDADKKTSKTRVIGGGVAAGVGVVGGTLGNSLINGKLGEKIKELKDKRNSTKENNEIINELKAGLRSAGMTNVNKLDLSKFDMTELSDMIHNTDFTKLSLNGKDATKYINTSNLTSLQSSLTNLFKQP